MTDRSMALFGTDEPPEAEHPLAAGPLTAVFSAGALRSISLQGVEVIRSISFLIRDRNWSTATPEIRDLKIAEDGAGFALSFAAHCRTPSDDQPLVWCGRIAGSAADGLSFEVEATPEADFHTCRTGFVILHPLERVVGCRAEIEHSDGRVEVSAFPDRVDPLQCFLDIRAMTHEPLPGIRATCRMEGGAWETEDHRNWLDASFKTYFRPLALPWPYVVPAGETIRQSVTLTFSPPVAALPAVAPEGETLVSVGDRTGAAMPRIGLSARREDLDAALAAAPVAATAGAAALALRVASNQPDLPGVLRKGAALAAALGAAPELEIVVVARNAPEVEIDLVAAAAASAGLVPASVAVSPDVDLKSYPPSVDRPTSPPLEVLYAAARASFPGVPVGGGMFAYFTELNRRRPPVRHLDFVQHATATNVHAGDDRSIMETLESLPHVFRSMRGIAGGVEYRLGPAAIGMAFNPYGAATTPNPDRLKRAMVTEDPRHGALFGAAYAAGYLARAAQGGVARVTMGAPAGPFGIVAGAQPLPVFHVLAGFAGLADAAVLQTASSDPRALLAIAAEGPAGRELWLANLTPETKSVRLAGLRPAGLAVMDIASDGGFADRPAPTGGTLDLDAYAVARVTW